MTVLADRARALARRTESELVALWRRHETGGVDGDGFVTAAAALLTQARAAGVTLADLALTAEIARALRSAATPLGLGVDADEPARLAAGVRTVLDADVASATTPDELSRSREARLARLARDVPLQAVADAAGTAMAARGVAGWVRVTDADPCVRCSAWADGKVRPPGTRMARHVGCSCIQQPVFSQ